MNFKMSCYFDRIFDWQLKFLAHVQQMQKFQCLKKNLAIHIGVLLSLATSHQSCMFWIVVLFWWKIWGWVEIQISALVVSCLEIQLCFSKPFQMPLSDNCMEFSPSKIIDDCEDLSLLLNSEGLPLVYVGTSHQLLSLDTRYGWNQRWTHLMEAPPMYGSIYCDAR